MSDQGIWFKLHRSALDDPDLDNLPIADFGRWAKLGTFIKVHGEGGIIHLKSPSRTLCAKLQVGTFEDLLEHVSCMPGVMLERREKRDATGVTSATVTYKNWNKYQGDFSRDRMAKLRLVRRSRGEEKRREEKRGEKTLPSPLAGAGEKRDFSAFKALCSFLVKRYTPYNPESEEPVQKRAVGTWVKDHSRELWKIYDLCLGDKERASKGVEAVELRLTAWGTETFSLNALCRWMPDWMSDPGGFDAETTKTKPIRK